MISKMFEQVYLMLQLMEAGKTKLNKTKKIDVCSVLKGFPMDCYWKQLVDTASLSFHVNDHIIQN